MKKTLALLVFFAMMLSTIALAEFNFDISPFENNSSFEIEYDDMDDTAEINCTDDILFLGASEGDEGFLLGLADIKITQKAPPVIRISFAYYGEDWVFIDKLILKPGDTRYTFEVDRDTDVEDGKIYEYFTLALTDESVKMIGDIVNGGITSIRYRMDGDRDLDGELVLSNLEGLTNLYNCYMLSGALNNDFSALRQAFPCTVK